MKKKTSADYYAQYISLKEKADNAYEKYKEEQAEDFRKFLIGNYFKINNGGIMKILDFEHRNDCIYFIKGPYVVFKKEHYPDNIVSHFETYAEVEVDIMQFGADIVLSSPEDFVESLETCIDSFKMTVPNLIEHALYEEKRK